MKERKKSYFNLLLFVSSSSKNQNLEGKSELWTYQLGKHKKQLIVARQRSDNKAMQQ
jgi:hypothetical protein